MSKFRAIYSRYHQRYEEEFDTAKEAAEFLMRGEDYGTLSWVMILNPEGEVIANASTEEAAYSDLENLINIKVVTNQSNKDKSL